MSEREQGLIALRMLANAEAPTAVFGLLKSCRLHLASGNVTQADVQEMIARSPSEGAGVEFSDMVYGEKPRRSITNLYALSYLVSDRNTYTVVNLRIRDRWSSRVLREIQSDAKRLFFAEEAPGSLTPIENHTQEPQEGI